MNPVTAKLGSTVHILVPFHSIHDRPTGADGLDIENAPAVFIPVHRG